MKIIYITLLTASIIGLSSCDLDLLEDPNNLTPDAASADFVLNSIEFGLNEYFFELTELTMEVTRMIAANPRGGTYESYWQPQDFDDSWEQAYTGILSDCQNLISLTQDEGLTTHAGIAQTIQAYTLMTLVDIYGDVPWTEALDPSNLNPVLDGGATVYATAESLLNAASDNFQSVSLGVPANDLFYSGNSSQWLQLVNSLKLKLYLTTRLVDGSAAGKIGALIQDDNFITPASDWDFPFSNNSSTTPSSQNPFYVDNYGAASDYMSNYYMNLLLQDKSVTDPRVRYYFYRQTLDISTDVNELPCIVRNKPGHYTDDMIFCNAGDGYWGRDHIDVDGIPPDNLLRTIFGLYPVGGQFDSDQGAGATTSSGAQGVGIHPMMHSSWIQFMLAESALTIGTTGDPRALLEAGVRRSIDKVMNFAPGQADPAFTPTADDVEGYVSAMMEKYDNAVDDDERLDVIMTEYYIALFGNGFESYNNYRRTGKPANLQLPLNPQPGSFTRSFPYPSNFINRNSNVASKGSVAITVFWDTNPPDFVD
ncbi:MAG: SusD/RagB family nutrient-binding outer membrane lipoprotein [Saprospiraceae bacterium]|nr:SusD/RagB family nutrient-binding outer membrane lipoprotein [Saprospiraceae bacterium]